MKAGSEVWGGRVGLGQEGWTLRAQRNPGFRIGFGKQRLALCARVFPSSRLKSSETLAQACPPGQLSVSSLDFRPHTVPSLLSYPVFALP